MSRPQPVPAPPGPAGRQPSTGAEPPPRYALLDGRIGLPTLGLYLRTLPATALWLGAYPLLGRLAVRAGRPEWTTTLQRTWARGLARHLGLRLDLRGLEHVRSDETYVVVALHEGLADVLAMLHLPLRMRFVVRDEIFGWRVVGPYLRATDQIEVCPERGTWSYRRVARKVRSVLAGGESVVVFPQGSILGIETAFRPGAFALARASGRPVLPVAITGSHRVWEYPYTPRVRYGQRVSLRVLEPVSIGPRDDPYVVCAGTQRRLKAVALSGQMTAPRRFVPTRDGYWDGYAYEIDPAFPELAADVARRRAGRPLGRGPSSDAV